MPAKLKLEQITYYTLEKTDILLENTGPDASPTRIAVRQAKQGEHELRNSVYDQVQRIFDENGARVEQRVDYSELRRLEVYLTLADCNLQDETGAQIFRFKDNRLDMTREEFDKTWALLNDPRIAEEIHAFVLDKNVLWRAGGN